MAEKRVIPTGGHSIIPGCELRDNEIIWTGSPIFWRPTFNFSTGLLFASANFEVRRTLLSLAGKESLKCLGKTEYSRHAYHCIMHFMPELRLCVTYSPLVLTFTLGCLRHSAVSLHTTFCAAFQWNHIGRFKRRHMVLHSPAVWKAVWNEGKFQSISSIFVISSLLYSHF